MLLWYLSAGIYDERVSLCRFIVLVLPIIHLLRDGLAWLGENVSVYSSLSHTFLRTNAVR